MNRSAHVEPAFCIILSKRSSQTGGSSVTETGYIKSPHLDDKAGVAVMLAAPPAPETVALHERLRRGEPI